MVRLMNHYDREAILKALIIWETVCAEFVSHEQLEKFHVGESFTGLRLAQLPNSTSHVDARKLADEIHKCSLIEEEQDEGAGESRKTNSVPAQKYQLTSESDETALKG